MNFLTTIVTVFLLSISQSFLSQNTQIKIIDSDNNWPMFGGPEGNWKIKTKHPIPKKWSVRNSKNIKWKKSLPEGGQSGIAIWNDKLFLTINPPLNTPKYKIIEEQYNLAKHNYKSLYNSQIQNLRKNKDVGFYKKSVLKEKSNEYWNTFLKQFQKNKKLSISKKIQLEKRLMKKTPQGKQYLEVKKEYDDYVHNSLAKLKQAFIQFKEAEKKATQGAKSANIVLLCLSTNTGETLWSAEIKGTFESEYNYGFSDSTTPCPITDGKNVWAINASGGMACFTMNGNLVWERTWEPSSNHRPFNKQFNSVVYKNSILNMEPPINGDSSRNSDWNYLHAFNKHTGKRLWVTKEAITHYNAPIIGITKNNEPAILIGRGGPHDVPERPVGLSLISLKSGNQGNALWNWEPKEANDISGMGALSTQHWDKKTASWFYKGKEHLSINSSTGKLIAQKSLTAEIERYSYNLETEKYEVETVNLAHLENQRHCNILVGDYVYYMLRHQPYIARHNIKTGKNEHIELPREIDAKGDYIWKIPQENDGLNAQGQKHSKDKRVLGDGFQKCFLGAPTMVNNYIYFTNALGMVYVIDTKAEFFNKEALVAVNDLGEKGKTWTVNSLSYAKGKIFHRTLKEIICIENK